MDRVPGYEPVGRRFESCQARHVGAKSALLRRLFCFWQIASAAKKPPSPRSLTPPFPQKAPLAGVIYATGHGAPEEAASHFQLPGKRGSKPEGIVLIIRQDTSTRFADKTREARSRKCLSGNHNIILTREGQRERVLPFVKSGNLRRL